MSSNELKSPVIIRKTAMASMVIKDLCLSVKIGCSAEERRHLQEVRVTIKIFFHQHPEGISSDRIDDTICYAKICSLFQNYCNAREFFLIEKLAGDLYSLLDAIVGSNSSVKLTVHKFSPPIKELLGGVQFSIGGIN